MDEVRSRCLSLLEEAKTAGLYENLISQLQKDFERAGFPLSLTADISPDALATALHEKIYVLLLERFTDYLNLLYVIDVPERSFREIPLTDAVEISAEATCLVVQREWQKVWLKFKHSS